MSITKTIWNWIGLMAFCVSIGLVIGVIGGTAIVIARVIDAFLR